MEDVNLLSAVTLAGRALGPRGAAEFREPGNNQAAKVSNHLNSTLSGLQTFSSEKCLQLSAY